MGELLTRARCLEILAEEVGCEWAALPGADEHMAGAREARSGGMFVCRHGAIVSRRDVERVARQMGNAVAFLEWKHTQAIRPHEQATG